MAKLSLPTKIQVMKMAEKDKLATLDAIESQFRELIGGYKELIKNPPPDKSSYTKQLGELTRANKAITDVLQKYDGAMNGIAQNLKG